MANLKNTSFGGTSHLRLPVGSSAQRPNQNYPSGQNQSANPGYMRINSTTGFLEIYSGSAWESTVVAFPYRTIITTAFVQGGYKNSAAWKNVNKTFSATDTTVNLGDITERAHNYQWGACSKDYAYVFGAGDGHAVSSNYTTAFNMRTEVAMSDQTRNLAYSRHTFGGVFQEDRYAFISGGGQTSVEEYNLYTKTLIGTIGATLGSGSNWGMSHENIGIHYGDSGQQTFTFATRTSATRSGTAPGNHHQQKSIMSKYTYCYAGNDGSYAGGYTYRKTNMITNVTSVPSPTVNKPWGNCGEENYTLGQDWQYMLGQHDGSGQNNRSHKFIYATETGTTGSATLEPKGHDGMSSAVTSWCD